MHRLILRYILLLLVIAGGSAMAQNPVLLTATASDPDNSDSYYSIADRITLVFDVNTNQPAAGTKAQIDALLTFSVSLGTNYTGAWSSATTLVITIANNGSHGDPVPGVFTVTPTANIRDASNTFPALATPATLGGDWGTASALPFAGGSGSGQEGEETALHACANPYLGNDGSGCGTTATTTLTCTNPFAGGTHSGMEEEATALYACQTFYLGSDASGFTATTTITLTCTNPFAGGNGSGYEGEETALYACANFYIGNTGSGHVFGNTTNLTCTNPFAGGTHSGYEGEETALYACTNLYVGNTHSGDGYGATANLTCTNPFAGGTHSGYEGEETALYACTNLYVGNTHSGDTYGATANLTCTNPFAGGSHSGYEGEQTADYACQNLYVGNTHSGDSYGATANLTCTNPFAGGSHSGYEGEQTTDYACQNIFVGNTHSGFNYGATANLTCTNPFAGGSHSGYEGEQTGTSVCQNIFVGNTHSGYNYGATANLTCTNPFAGGSHSGFYGTEATQLANLTPTLEYLCLTNGTTQLSISNVADFPPTATFEWYDVASGGTALHTGSTFTTTVAPPGQTFYVRYVTAASCVAYARVPVLANLPAYSTLLTWTGAGTAGSNNWFDGNNWDGGGSPCLPYCGISVLIPGGIANQPSIDNDTAACQDLTLDDALPGAQLSMTNASSRLEVCGDWNHNAAFSNSSLGTVAFVGSATQNYNRNLNGTGDFHHVVLNNAMGLQLNETMTLDNSGVFTFMAGNVVTTGSTELKITNPAWSAVTGYSSTAYVQGRLRRALGGSGNYNYPVGTATDYQLASFNFTTATAITDLVAYFNPWPGLPPTVAFGLECGNDFNQEFLNHGYWRVEANPPAAAATGEYTVTLNSTGYTNEIGNAFTVAKSPSGAGTWSLQGTCVVGGTAASTSRTGVQGFSDFAVSQGTTPFPIDNLFLTAEPDQNQIMLRWLTLSELNNSGFHLERAVASAQPTFQAIAWVPGQLTTTDPTFYRQPDADVQPGVLYYYRLRQVDLDGTTRYSNVAQAMLTPAEQWQFSLYPNPARQHFSLLAMAPRTQQASLELINSLGQTVLRQPLELQPGASTLTIDTERLLPGTYVARITTPQGAELHRQKLILLK